MTVAPMYQNALPLNRHIHRRIRLRRTDGAAFAARMNSVPLALAEFAAAAREHAIVFARLDEGDYLPAIIVGLSDRRNLYLDGDGRWTQGYAPAFLRQYPFVLAEDRSADSAPTVCLDMAFEGISEEEGEPLFDEEGGETALLKNAMQFLGQYHAELKRTAAFAARLRESGLLEPRTLRVRHAGEIEELTGLYVVSEEKLAALDTDSAMPLLRSGELGAIYAHLHSLHNLERLPELRARAAAAGAEGGPNAEAR